MAGAEPGRRGCRWSRPATFITIAAAGCRWPTCSPPRGSAARWPRRATRCFPTPSGISKTRRKWPPRFARAPGAVERSCEIAARATFSLDELRYEYPEELAPAGRDAARVSDAAHLVRRGGALSRRRARKSSPADRARAGVDRLSCATRPIFSRSTTWCASPAAAAFLCQGRGSAANSAVCFCLGVTSVDPERMDVLFERFISRERDEAPDIDIDFEHERREEVLQYVYDKYGRERAGMTAEVITYRSRSAVRDVGKALGLSLDRVDKLAKSIDGYHEGQLAERCARRRPRSRFAASGRQLLTLVEELVGFPRHLGQHVGGMVITRGPLSELVPIENAAMPERTVIQWNKDDLDELGILKVDCLSLGMLTAIRKCFELVNVGVRPSERCYGTVCPTVARTATEGRPGERHGDLRLDAKWQWSGAGMLTTDRRSAALLPSTGRSCRPDLRTPTSDLRPPLTLATIPAEDPAVYDMICRADTMGVFQIESRAQMSMLPRLKPREFYDLVIEVAIVRPGPIQGNMVHPYLRRRAGDEAGHLSQRGDSRGAAQNARRAAVSGAGDAAGGRGGRLHARRGRSASPRDGGLAAHRRHRAIPPEADRRHAGPRAVGRVRRAGVSADSRLRRVRLSRIARGQLRAVGLRLGLAEVLSPGGVLPRADQQPADGFLCPGPARARRPRARRRSPRRRCELQRLGLHAGGGTEAGGRRVGDRKSEVDTEIDPDLSRS